MKTKYYAILLKKTLTLLKNILLGACRPSEVPEGLQVTFREADCRVWSLGRDDEDIDESIRDVYNPVSFVGLRSRHLLAVNG
jgi:hypothetical protein